MTDVTDTIIMGNSCKLGLYGGRKYIRTSELVVMYWIRSKWWMDALFSTTILSNSLWHWKAAGWGVVLYRQNLETHPHRLFLHECTHLQFHACSLLQSLILYFLFYVVGAQLWSDTFQTIPIVVYIFAVIRTSLVQPNKHVRVQKGHFSKQIRISAFLLTLLECYVFKLLSGEPKAVNCPT